MKNDLLNIVSWGGGRQRGCAVFLYIFDVGSILEGVVGGTLCGNPLLRFMQRAFKIHCFFGAQRLICMKNHDNLCRAGHRTDPWFQNTGNRG